MTAVSAPSPARRSPWPILLVLGAVFFLPFAAGSALFWSGWRPAGFVNHGQLVESPRTLPEGGLLDADGRPLTSAALRGKWTLLYAVDGACGEACTASLGAMRQAHLALGRETDRVQRVLVATSAGLPAGSDGLVAARVDPAALEAWRGAFGPAGIEQGVWVVDPFGRAILHYVDGKDRRGMRDDLERLLKYSWVR